MKSSQRRMAGGGGQEGSNDENGRGNGALNILEKHDILRPLKYNNFYCGL
jgi:hypothetical protein